MRWLTISQIKRRSKTAKGALKVSYEHWCQLYDATAKELRAEIKKTGRQLSRAIYCGLCEYNRNRCLRCILKGCKYSLWATANSELLDWYNKDQGDWHAWKRACKALRDKLGELIEEGTK